MSEVGFQNQSSVFRSDFRAVRDASPDSVIFTPESNFSLISSATASVDRCSFASDAHDQDCIGSEISLQLAGHERDHASSSRSDPDSNKPTVVHNKHSRLSRKGENEKGRTKDSEADGKYRQDSAGSTSILPKECQNRISRSEAMRKKPDRRRPASLDLNNASAMSPRLGATKKSFVSTRRSDIFPSPGTPNYRHASSGMQKGWSSERVPLHTNARRRQASAALQPFNNGRTLPSKWDDAERWIFSPVDGDGVVRPSVPQAQRRPKSKSGPLGPPGISYYSLYFPAMPMFDGGTFSAASPFSTGVLAANGMPIDSSGCGGGRPIFPDPCMGRSASLHGYLDMRNQSSMESSRDGFPDSATNISHTVSRRDMATQMSPESSTHSSPNQALPFSPADPSALSMVRLQRISSSKVEVRDVEVDERVTVTWWTKKHRAQVPGKGSENVNDWKAGDSQLSSSDSSDTSKSISNIKREEAKIASWENLQKAKAEAAMLKLEMKLEKKRSSSMDKIMRKLRSAQKKAQEMRSSVLANQGNQISCTSHKAVSFRRSRQMHSLSGCFTCHAF